MRKKKLDVSNILFFFPRRKYKHSFFFSCRDVLMCRCVAVLMCRCVDVLMCWWLCRCVDVLMCWCVDVLMCWCVDVLMCWCVDVLMCWCVDVLMCRCVDVLMTVLMCWCVDVLMCRCVDVLMCRCVDVLMCWCADVLMCWCVDVLMCCQNQDVSIFFVADFDGFPIDVTQLSILPVHLGLHHHGNQPDLAGYTLKEIFLLCRSSIPAQRIINLKILGKIIFNSRWVFSLRLIFRLYLNGT